MVAGGPRLPPTSCDTSLVVSGGVDCGRDDEMFITRNLDVMPKTTKQRIKLHTVINQ